MSTHNARRSSIVIALSLAGLLAATAAFRAPAPATSHPGKAETATLVVHNYGFSDRVIYVVSDGMRQRLGTAPAVSTTRFRIPRYYVDNGLGVRFLARDFAGFGVAVSRQDFLYPGDTVDMMIQAV